MADHGIIGTALEFSAEFQKGFSCFEKAFNGPSISINTHDFRIAEAAVRAEKVQAFALFIAVAYNDNFNRDSRFSCHDNRTKNIFVAVKTYKSAQFRQCISLALVIVALL